MKYLGYFLAIVILAGCTSSPPSEETPADSPSPSHTFATPFPDDFWEALPNGQTLKTFIDEDSGDCSALAEYYGVWEPSNVNPAAKILLLAYINGAQRNNACEVSGTSD